MATPHQLETLVHLRRARDAMDRDYASPLDVPTVARHALMSPAHFSRLFKAAYGETPYDYLVSRRIERARALLRSGASVTETCFEVGYTSLGSFSERFAAVTGESPSSYRARDHGQLDELPPCLRKVLARPAAGRAGSEKRANRVAP